MPINRAGLQGFVIALFAVFKNPLKADETAYGVIKLIEQQQSQQAGNTAVPVGKGVDTQKVQNTQRNQHQWVGKFLLIGVVVAG